jgi:hypothetical protein
LVELAFKDELWTIMTQLNAIACLQWVTTLQVLPIQVCAIGAIQVTNLPAR